MNNAEAVRGRSKTEAYIEGMREGGMAKIYGMDEGNEGEGAGGREESDEWEEFREQKGCAQTRSSPSKSAGEGGTRDDASSVSQLVQALHHGERTRRGLSQNDGGRAACSGSALGYMFMGDMGDEKEGKTLAFLVATGRETKAVFSTVVPRKTTGEWICRRLMAWLREIGLESKDIIVKSDNEPALTSLIASWSTMRARRADQG